MKTTRYLIVFGIIVLLVGLFIWYKATPGKYDRLATCLKDSGAVFYGAFWCPHCQEAKRNFSKSASLLPYVECSTPDGKDTTPLCKEARISGYPTWEFSKPFSITQTEGDRSFACSSEEGQLELSCQNAFEGTWMTFVQGRKFMSPQQPSVEEGTWMFPESTRSIGTTEPELIAAFAQCPVE